MNGTSFTTPLPLLEARRPQISRAGSGDGAALSCEKKSLAGAVSQRACVFCGSRVVLYPVADALHLIHGPIGCAAYTWDIRGALSSGPELHRMSFCTDLQEIDIISGGDIGGFPSPPVASLVLEGGGNIDIIVRCTYFLLGLF